MSQHPLTPAQAERLAYLAEECGEVVQAVGKILRHGYDSHNPEAPEKGNNRQQLEVELGNVRTAIDLLGKAGDIKKLQVLINAQVKRKKMGRYFHHQDGLL